MLLSIDRSLEEEQQKQQQYSSQLHTTLDTVDRPSGQEPIDKQPTSIHVYDNPFQAICDFNEVNPRAPPLFAIRFPDLFVY